MCFYLVYPSFSLISVVQAVSMVISLPGASRFKAQMVAICDAVRAMAPITPEVTEYSWRMLSTPGGCSAILGVIWAFFHGGCLLEAAPAEVTGSGLLWWRSLP